jgi:DNA-binding SARP family transcriptional activator
MGAAPAPGGPSLLVLGELQVLRDGQPLALPPSKKTRALLAYLALTGRPHRRERLCSLLWDVTDDPRGALRWSLTRLRPLVDGPDVRHLIADRETVAFDRAGVDIDLARVQRAVQQLDTAPVDELEHCAALFRGELLEGLELSEFDDFQAWCVAERENARRLRATLARALVERLRDRPEQALPHARTLTQVEPLDEAARADLVRLLAGLGRVLEARQHVDATRRTFSELGLVLRGPLDEAARALQSPMAVQAAARTSLAEKEAPAPSGRLRPAPIGRSTIHGLRLVGRDASVARLAETLDAAKAQGRARVILLRGEPGVGKSRLLVEVAIEVRRRRGTPIEGAAFELEQARAYGPWIDALRRLPKSSLPPDLIRHLEPLVAGTGETARDGRRESFLEAVIDFVSDRARAAPPVAVLLDDAQWLDGASLELLHYLVRVSAQRPLLIVLAARDGEIADNTDLLRALRSFRRARILEEHPVERLDRDATVRLVGLVEPQANGERIFLDSGGNPLYALELARSGAGPSDTPSGSVAEIVRERVERLPDEAADVLRWAAILGSTFQSRWLRPLVRLEEDALVQALETLEQHALIGSVIDPADPGGTFEFAHELVRRVVYGDVSSPRRRLMHQKAAEAMATVPEHEDSLVIDLAHHAREAGDARLETEACLRAATQSLRLDARAQATSLLRRALRASERLPEPERSARRGELEALKAKVERPRPSA